MSFDRYHWGWPASSIAALVATVLVPHPSSVGLFLHALFDWLHVPVFGLISIALLALMPRSWRGWRRFGLALLAALFLAGLTEMIQIPMRRDASWQDVLADGTGAIAFLLAAYAVGRKSIVAMFAGIAAMTLLIGSALPVFSVAKALIHRNSQFPVIFNGDIDSERTFVGTKSAYASTHWSNKQRRYFTRLELLNGRWPGLTIHDPAPDWSSFSNLLLHLELEGEGSIEITIRVHDKAHYLRDRTSDDRFSVKFTLNAGQTQFSIPIAEIQNAPRERIMDMTAIDGLIIYSRGEYAGRAIRFYEIRLD